MAWRSWMSCAFNYDLSQQRLQEVSFFSSRCHNCRNFSKFIMNKFCNFQCKVRYIKITIGQTEVEDEIETTTSTYNTNQQAEQALPKDMSSLTQRTVRKCGHCKQVYMTLSGRLRHETNVHTNDSSSSIEKPKGKTPELVMLHCNPDLE